jgi:hypothetical protein
MTGFLYFYLANEKQYTSIRLTTIWLLKLSGAVRLQQCGKSCHFLRNLNRNIAHRLNILNQLSLR